ncbi:hypothetical protein MCP_1399 [Methanocella paludicola SANAE]|uniref:Replication-associated protein ORF2/G2P domain-containing protein n=2 Tax=Methanocella TaxID=570266 RepID=D1YYE9_METPS|nr:hypothetical protein MCP_1399 [Methanocella paludicola SANAE]
MPTNCIKPIGYGQSTTTGERFHIPCKKWDCPVCSRVRKNKLLDDVNRFFRGEHVRFMTLTERSTAKNKDKIMKHYRRLMDNLKKEYPGLKAFWVKEFTKRGVRHLHVALNMYIPQARIKKLWTRATDGESYIVHIEDTCEVRNAAGYMMKYMTKQLEGGDNFKTHERRYGFNGEKRPKPPEWEGKAEGEIEVEIDPHFNPQLKILVQLLQYEPNRIWPLLH